MKSRTVAVRNTSLRNISTRATFHPPQRVAPFLPGDWVIVDPGDGSKPTEGTVEDVCIELCEGPTPRSRPTYCAMYTVRFPDGRKLGCAECDLKPANRMARPAQQGQGATDPRSRQARP